MCGTDFDNEGGAEVSCIWLHTRSDDQLRAQYLGKKLAIQELPQQTHHLTPHPLRYVNLREPSRRASKGHATEEDTDTHLVTSEETDTRWWQQRRQTRNWQNKRISPNNPTHLSTNVSLCNPLDAPQQPKWRRHRLMVRACVPHWPAASACCLRISNSNSIAGQSSGPGIVKDTVNDLWEKQRCMWWVSNKHKD